MTIEGPDQGRPSSDAEEPSASAERYSRAASDKRSHPSAERQNLLINLTDKVVASWGNTLRALLILAALIFGLWVLRASLNVGPLHIPGRP